LWPYRAVLRNRPNFSGRTYADDGRAWYDWHQVHSFPQEHRKSITFSWVATHNHFALLRGRVAPLNSAPVVELGEEDTEENAIRLTAVLNTSAACFWLKQYCQSKGQPRPDQTGSGEPWTEIYEFAPGRLRDLPLPARFPAWRATELNRLARARDALRPERVSPTVDALASAQQGWELTRSKMIALQEELDWEVYGEYGFLDTTELVSSHEVPPIQVGERAFEIVLARKVAAGEAATTWFTAHRARPVTAVPAHWPVAYRSLVERRIAAIERLADLAVLERPEFKRRWTGESWDRLQRDALNRWLLDECEASDIWFEQGIPRTRTLDEIAEHLAGKSAVVEAAAVYAPELSVADVLSHVISDAQLPSAAALRYRESGLRKCEQWKEVWAAQQSEDDALSAGVDWDTADINRSKLVPPRFTAVDFLRNSYWSQRGKFDVPRERFISYPALESEIYFGWAGWDHSQRAEALGSLICRFEKSSKGNVSAEIVPLLASLDELIPWLERWHSATAPRWVEFRDNALVRHNLTGDDLATWRPPKPRRGRPPKARS
jgi:hypothetical protein